MRTSDRGWIRCRVPTADTDLRAAIACITTWQNAALQPIPDDERDAVEQLLIPYCDGGSSVDLAVRFVVQAAREVDAVERLAALRDADSHLWEELRSRGWLTPAEVDAGELDALVTADRFRDALGVALTDTVPDDQPRPQ